MSEKCGICQEEFKRWESRGFTMEHGAVHQVCLPDSAYLLTHTRADIDLIIRRIVQEELRKAGKKERK